MGATNILSGVVTSLQGGDESTVFLEDELSVLGVVSVNGWVVGENSLTTSPVKSGEGGFVGHALGKTDTIIEEVLEGIVLPISGTSLGKTSLGSVNEGSHQDVVLSGDLEEETFVVIEVNSILLVEGGQLFQLVVGDGNLSLSGGNEESVDSQILQVGNEFGWSLG